jgi:oxygen-independent coproporphyrinogen-3 oxidase
LLGTIDNLSVRAAGIKSLPPARNASLETLQIAETLSNFETVSGYSASLAQQAVRMNSNFSWLRYCLMADLELDRSSLPAAEIPGLYVHIPFCFHKCHYCDFYSITRQTPERMAGFVDRMLKEADSWCGGSVKVKPRTVFFGGGTPSLLPIEEMRRLILGLRELFDFSACNEFTIEANPATVWDEYARMLVDCGVNRVSMGAQSFDLKELAILERHHEPADVARSLEILRSAGISRLNIDLIYGVPGQSMSAWMRSLERAIKMGTEHLSCYGLTYEPNTPLAVRRRLGLVSAIEPELEVEMMRATRARLRDARLEPYEISNYSKPGAECRHNLLYWTGGGYIGLGPSAASHVDGMRWKNRPHLGEWETAIDSGELPAIEVEQLDLQERAGELAMLMLRLTKGIDDAVFTARIGRSVRSFFADVIDRLTQLGLLEPSESGICLSERGIPVMDSVAAEFVSAASVLKG